MHVTKIWSISVNNAQPPLNAGKNSLKYFYVKLHVSNHLKYYTRNTMLCNISILIITKKNKSKYCYKICYCDNNKTQVYLIIVLFIIENGSMSSNVAIKNTHNIIYNNFIL